MVAPISAGAGIKFESTTDSGALLFLDAPAKSKDIESKRHIINYMHDNIKNWFEFANADYSWGLELKEQDIIFVSGTTKTSRWAVAAFQGNTYKMKEGHVTGDFGPFASAGFSVKIENQILPASHYRHGPRQPSTIVSGGSLTYPGYSQPSLSHPPNQTLFVHYYKMKRRWVWPFKGPMRAAGGPHQLPPGPDNPGTDAPVPAEGEYEFVPEQELDTDQVCAHDACHRFPFLLTSSVSQVYDPVTVLLDYILSVRVPLPSLQTPH